MKTISKALDEQLQLLGYNENIRNSARTKIDISIIENKLTNVDDFTEYVEVFKYDEPSVDINRAYLNINNEFIQTAVLEGDIQTIASETVFQTRFIAADYALDKRTTILAIGADYKLKIFTYAPSQRGQVLNAGRRYEDAYKKDRNEVTLEYKQALERRGKMKPGKIQDILTMLVADYIIDEIFIENLNPAMKICDEPDKYAEGFTQYSLRFINNRTNRLGIFEKTPVIRRLGRGVVAGVCSNNPYLKLHEMPPQTNFPMKEISYYWIKNNKKNQEEIGIYTATHDTQQISYSDYLKESLNLSQLADELNLNLRRSVQTDNDCNAFLLEVLKSLNLDLVMPQTSIINTTLNESDDTIEPFMYRYRFYNDPQEFEQHLYVSIEDDIRKQYKYRISENVLEDLTRVGTKLEYTNQDNQLIRRQSVADFNVNAPTAVITMETIIDESKLNDLLGYLYDDIETSGTDKLPIPTACVDIYVPKSTNSGVSMYNGTKLEFSLDAMQTENLFYSPSNARGATIPGTTFVTVRCVNSKGEVLKENTIPNMYPKSSYVPELIPIINDRDGREWRAELTRMEPIIVSDNPEQNVVSIKYIERFARVTFSFINREGKKIADDKQEIVQVGETYNFESKKKLIANDNDEWSFKFSRPNKFVVKDDEEKNKVILVYDIERADVTIKYLNKTSNEELVESKVVTVQVNKKFVPDIPKIVIDANGLVWSYVEDANVIITPQMETQNEVLLYYVEAKVPVTVRYKNEQGITLTDDKVEFVQIGKNYSYEFESKLTDFECKHWLLKEESKSFKIVVKKEKERNLIEGIYEPELANITIRFLNEEGRAIKSDEITKAQIGSVYDREQLDEVIDNYGKVWSCISKDEKIVVKSKEIENQFLLKYEPLIGTITIKYLDSEQNELMPAKFEKAQVGSFYKNRPIPKFTSQDGKHWQIDPEKVEGITVKKYDEENIYSIYYDPEKAEVTLRFYDAYNNKLKEEQVITSQIGAPLSTKSFEKITDDKGQRWMLETSEPKNLVVKDHGNAIKIIYGEIKAKVLVKYVEVQTGKLIIDNLVTTVKLGGIYIPNIQQIILDKNKWQWQYVGDQNISIVTKENEQENIIVLNYEEKRANVILKYRNTKEEKIREDSVKQVQIGKEIKLDPLQKLTDSNGLMWKYNTSKLDNKVVAEGDNIAFCVYEPLLAEIKIKYLGEESEIIPPKELKMQVGKEFKPEILNRVLDGSNQVWVYQAISEEAIIVKEEYNEILMSFDKLLSKVTVILADEDGNQIAVPREFDVQVGAVFIPKYEQNFVDAEQKEWVFAKIDRNQINVNEQKDKNVIKVYYAKDLSPVTLIYYSSLREKIAESTVEKVQIGSIYIPKPPKEIIDATTHFGWLLPESYHEEHQVKRKPEENDLEVHYEQLKVKVTVKYRDPNNDEIMEDTLYEEQVGTTFVPKIEKVMIDPKEREWLYGWEENKGLLGAALKPKEDVSLVVQRQEENNVVILKYRPSLAKVTIKYQEALGNLIKADTTVMAQIGSVYEAEVPNAIEDTKKVKWVFNPNSEATVKVTHEEEKNLIVLAYEEEKAMVTYKYHDEFGNRLRAPKRKLAQIGSIYEPEVESVVEDLQGKVWEYHSKNVKQLEVKEDETQNVIEIVYTPLLVDTILRFVNRQGKQIEKDSIIKAQLGAEFSPDIQQKITDSDSKLFQFVSCEPESKKIVEKPIGALESPNLFELTYEPVYTNAIVTFKSIDGKIIKEDEKTELQVGTIFDPAIAQFITDINGIQWELISKDVDSIRLKEDVRENIVAMVYEIAKAEVVVRYRNLDGELIKKPDTFTMKVGEEFIPKIEQELVDDENRVWSFSMVDPVKLTVGSINNIINVSYQEKKANVIVKFQSKEGEQVKEDQRLKVQIGSRFEPKNTTKVIYNSDKIWRFVGNEPSMIIVSENAQENVIVQVYTEEEREIETVDENKPYYNPDVEKFIDQELVAEEAEKEKEEEEKRLEIEKQMASAIKLEDPKLSQLEGIMALSNEEKQAIIRLNELNTAIILELNTALSQLETLNDAELEDKINVKMNEEQTIISAKLAKLIEDDKSGKNLLKIFEIITSSEISDQNFNLLQQRKTILVADYYVSRKVSEDEQASYICDKGIIEKKIECINQMLALPVNPKDKTRPAKDMEYKREKVVALYEKQMILHYNRARSVVKDDYFVSEESKAKLSPDVVLMVGNMLPNRALKLMQKMGNLSQEKEIELEAILKLLNAQQMGILNEKVNSIQDGKARKLSQKKLKDLVGK